MTLHSSFEDARNSSMSLLLHLKTRYIHAAYSCCISYETSIINCAAVDVSVHLFDDAPATKPCVAAPGRLYLSSQSTMAQPELVNSPLHSLCFSPKCSSSHRRQRPHSLSWRETANERRHEAGMSRIFRRVWNARIDSGLLQVHPFLHNNIIVLCLAKVSFWYSGVNLKSPYYSMLRRIVQILDGVHLIANGITSSSLLILHYDSSPL